MGARTKLIDGTENTPGPGFYRIERKIDACTATFGKATEKKEVIAQAPSPAAYNPNYRYLKQSCRDIKISGRHTAQQKYASDTMYTLPSCFDTAARGRGPTLKGRIEQRVRTDSPGPAAY